MNDRTVKLADRAAQAGLALGILLVLQPWWASGLRYGFFVTLFATILHIATSRLLLPDETP